SGADCREDGDFAFANRRAGQQQIRYIGACDEQNETHRTDEDQQRRTHVADDGVLQRLRRRLALITLDLGRSFGASSLSRLHEMAKQSNGISWLLVAASHTHSAPIVQDEYKNGPPAWEQAALVKIGQALARPGSVRGPAWRTSGTTVCASTPTDR